MVWRIGRPLRATFAAGLPVARDVEPLSEAADCLAVLRLNRTDEDILTTLQPRGRLSRQLVKLIKPDVFRVEGDLTLTRQDMQTARSYRA